MKKLSPIAYRALFFKHVWRFLGNVTTARELQASHAIAVSGGLDSMTLLWVAKSLHEQGKIGPVRALFVHHHTRDGQNDEMEVIRKFCKQENIPFKSLHVQGLNIHEGNFEARARSKRRELLLNELADKEKLWHGHHLDDSYEWNMMQRNRSSNPKSSIGIPVRNGPIVRPFLCVSRAQIKRLAKFEGIPYREDPSNLDMRYDRNYLRHKVIPLIRKRYPKYLKYYSHFANFSAMLLNQSVTGRLHGSNLHVYEYGAIIQSLHFSEIQIQELIHHFSNTDRGEIISQIQKMLRAIDNGKKGPFQFSGGVEAYHSYNLLMIYCQKSVNNDHSIAKALELLTDEQLKDMPSYKRVELKHAWDNLLQSPDTIHDMPGLVLVLESDSICKTLNTSVFDPLFPAVSYVCKNRGLRFIPFLKCLQIWNTKKEKLPEKLRLLPLCNLSNLFPSQG